MSIDEKETLRETLKRGIKVAVSEALERHRRLGESIVIWRDGALVTLKPDEIEILDQSTYGLVESLRPTKSKSG